MTIAAFVLFGLQNLQHSSVFFVIIADYTQARKICLVLLVKNELSTELIRLKNSLYETHCTAKQLSTKPGLKTTDLLMLLHVRIRLC